MSTRTMKICDICGRDIPERMGVRWVHISRHPWGDEADICHECGNRLGREMNRWRREHGRDPPAPKRMGFDRVLVLMRAAGSEAPVPRFRRASWQDGIWIRQGLSYPGTIFKHASYGSDVWRPTIRDIMADDWEEIE